MNRKILTRLLSVLLVVVMTFGLLPVSASAAWWNRGDTAETQPAETADRPVVDTQAATDNSNFIRAFHLDCGRRYFSVDNIKTIIDNLKKNNYTHLELAFGNDALRFLLKDMSLTVNEKMYSSNAVEEAITHGNTAFTQNVGGNLTENALTESEMNEIISYAKNADIEIIPMFDAPGHLYAVIQAIYELTGTTPTYDTVSKSGSSPNRAIDPTDTTSIAFVQALIEKYITYFAEKGSKYFNIAGDECGFSSMDDTTYASYIALMNTLAAKVESAGMTALMFSDGVYYGNSKTIDTSSGSKNADDLSRDIVLCYWTAGGNKAPATALVEKDFKILNTNTYWYYVAGRDTGGENGGWSNAYSLPWVKYYVNNKDNGNNNSCLKVDGAALGAISPIGCMIAMWCDDPYNTLDWNNIAEYISLVPSKNPTYFVAAPEFAITGATNLPVDATAVLTANKDVLSWTVDKYDVVSISRTSTTTATATARAVGDATITAISTSGKTATHTITVTDGSEPGVEKTVTISLTVGDAAHTETQNGVNNKGKENKSNLDEDIATVTVDGNDKIDDFKLATSITSGNQYYISDGNGNFLKLNGSSLTNTKDQADATLWTISGDSSNGYTISSSGNYLRYNNGLTTTTNDWYATEWSYSSTNGFSYSSWSFSGTRTYYLKFNSNSWTATTGANNQGYPYTGETKPASTSITFTPVAEGTTEITVGSIKYMINVKAKTATVDIQMSPNETLDLKAQIKESGSVTYETVSANNVTVNGGVLSNGKEDGSAEVKATVKNAAGYTVAVYTFKITVATEDLTGATKLPIQLWITSQTIQLTQAKDGYATDGTSGNFGGGKAQYLSLDPKTVNNSQGKALSECLPLYVEQHYEYGGTWYADEQTGKQPFDFMLWKGTVHNSGFQQIWGSSLIYSGTDFQYVRYYKGEWAVSADRVNWMKVTGEGSTTSASGCTQQIVAYYYMRTKLTDEVTTNIVDWGNPYENYSSTAYVLLDFAVMLESGTRVPSLSEFPIKERTLAYHCNGDSDTCGTANDTAYRRIDQIEATKADDYEIYMITLTPSSDTRTTQLASNCKNNTAGSGIYKGTEKVIWVSSVEDLNKTDFADSSLWYSSPSGANAFDPTDTTGKYVGGAAELSSVEIYKNQGLLVTYYVRAKTENKITVHYIDKVNNKEFHTIELSVNKDTYFNSGFGMGTALNTLVNNTVKTVNGATETVQADLKHLPTVPAEYRRVTYKLVETALQPGKDAATDAYLYYEFDNNAVFVADFGLPLTITPVEVNSLLEGTTITNAKATVSSGVPLTVNTNDNNNIVVTPMAGFAAGKSGVTFTLEYTGRRSGSTTEATVAYRITIIPASNVLYEENFLTTTDTANWTMTPAGITSAQQLQKANDGKTYNVFGYDGAYAGSDNENGVWKATGLTTTAATGELTADFYGNAFDLIGNCGPTTGRVMLIIAKQSTRQGLKAAIVDTRYTSDIYQVPLAHLEMDTEGAYTAYVYAAGLKATGAKQAAAYSAPALMSVNAANDPAADILAEYGLSVADAEYIGGDQIAASPIAVRRAPAVATYASIEHGAGDHVEIAGFRVYRDTTGTVAKNYPTAEQNLTYTNIIDLLGSKIITATVEGGNVVSCTPTEYEKNGGPQNEVYLAQNQAISFGVSTGDPIQVSLRAVSGTSDYNGTEISSITEMYYEVEPKLVDGQYTVTIMNKQSDGLLAIGNVKVPNSVTVQTTSELSDNVILASVRAVYAAAPEPVEPELFTPDTFKVHVTSLPMFRSKIVTLGITVSKDVAYVTVNGRTYTPAQFFSRWLKTVTIPVTETISRSETRTYTIIAYNSDGTASEPIVVKG